MRCYFTNQLHGFIVALGEDLQDGDKAAQALRIIEPLTKVLKENADPMNDMQVLIKVLACILAEEIESDQNAFSDTDEPVSEEDARQYLDALQIEDEITDATLAALGINQKED